MNSPKISVIIPAYGHAGLVLETLESVFAQTFADHEIIVVNDGSPDDTADRLRPLTEAGRIRYFEQANQGQAGARNRGLAEARGEFVAYLDDDDLWPPDKLEWQLRWLEERRCDVVVGNVSYLGGRDFVPVWAEEGEVLEYRSFFAGNPIISPGQALIRGSLLKRIGPWDGRFRGSDDLDLWFRIAKKTPLWVTARIALHYRLHANNASKNAVLMATNVWAVLERHLEDMPRAERAFYHREAEHYLQGFLGARLITTVKSALVHGHLGLAVQAIQAMRPFLKKLPSDWRALKRFLYDCHPKLGHFVAKKLGVSR